MWTLCGSKKERKGRCGGGPKRLVMGGGQSEKERQVLGVDV